MGHPPTEQGLGGLSRERQSEQKWRKGEGGVGQHKGASFFLIERLRNMLQVNCLKDNKASVWICAHLTQQQQQNKKSQSRRSREETWGDQRQGGRQAKRRRGPRAGIGHRHRRRERLLPGKDGEGFAWRKHSSTDPRRTTKSGPGGCWRVGAWQRKPTPALARRSERPHALTVLGKFPTSFTGGDLAGKPGNLTMQVGAFHLHADPPDLMRSQTPPLCLSLTPVTRP